MNHLRDVFHFDISGMKSILNDIIIVFKNLLKNIHKIIMNQIEAKSNPPLKD